MIFIPTGARASRNFDSNYQHELLIMSRFRVDEGFHPILVNGLLFKLKMETDLLSGITFGFQSASITQCELIRNNAQN